jgi:hypothetical protein
MAKKVQKPKTHLELLQEAHKLMDDMLNGFEKVKQGHVFPQDVYERAEEWVGDHDFS